MEPGYMAKCIGNWACTRWLVYCFAGYYRHSAVICSLIFAAIFVMLRLKPKPALSGNSEKKTLESVKEGIRFVIKTKSMLGALSLDLFAVLFGGAVAMIPVYARDILQVGATGLAGSMQQTM